METFVRITALCLLGAVLAVFLKEGRGEMGFLLSLAVCAAAMAALAAPLGEVLALFDEMVGWSGLDSALFAPLVRIAGLSVVANVGSELCRDAGEGAAAALIEIGGAAAALLLAAPLFRSVWELLRSLI